MFLSLSASKTVSSRETSELGTLYGKDLKIPLNGDEVEAYTQSPLKELYVSQMEKGMPLFLALIHDANNADKHFIFDAANFLRDHYIHNRPTNPLTRQPVRNYQIFKSCDGKFDLEGKIVFKKVCDEASVHDSVGHIPKYVFACDSTDVINQGKYQYYLSIYYKNKADQFKPGANLNETLNKEECKAYKAEKISSYHQKSYLWLKRAAGNACVDARIQRVSIYSKGDVFLNKLPSNKKMLRELSIIVRNMPREDQRFKEIASMYCESLAKYYDEIGNERQKFS